MIITKSLIPHKLHVTLSPFKSIFHVLKKGSVWREVITIVRVITHISKMDLTGKGNRMDYISAELDELLSEREDFGYGQMLITSNVEGAISDNWLARTMTFTSTNSNVLFCG